MQKAGFLITRLIWWMKLVLCIHVYDISLRVYINCVLSGRIGTLVTMATYMFIDLKWEMWIFTFFCLNGDNWNFFFTEMLMEQSSVFHINFVLIPEFDWLPGRH